MVQLPYRGNDMISVLDFSNCPWSRVLHWPIDKDLDLSFICGHHHLSEYMDISRQAEYFIARYTVLTRPNKVETAVHGCNCWLSVWTLSCRCPVKLFTKYQPCIIVCFLERLSRFRGMIRLLIYSELEPAFNVYVGNEKLMLF